VQPVVVQPDIVQVTRAPIIEPATVTAPVMREASFAPPIIVQAEAVRGLFVAQPSRSDAFSLVVGVARWRTDRIARTACARQRADRLAG
jgi:hypothetical protein